MWLIVVIQFKMCNNPYLIIILFLLIHIEDIFLQILALKYSKMLC